MDFEVKQFEIDESNTTSTRIKMSIEYFMAPESMHLSCMLLIVKSLLSILHICFTTSLQRVRFV